MPIVLCAYAGFLCEGRYETKRTEARTTEKKPNQVKINSFGLGWS